MVGCVETVAKGIVVIGGEREDAAYFREALTARCGGRLVAVAPDLN
jgi:hypothetical protein